MSTYAFCGNFRDLIPAGYMFAKLYTRNRRCYYKDIDQNAIWVWQSKRRIEINDLYSNSGLIIDKILHEETPKDGWVINTLSRVVEAFDRGKHDLLTKRARGEITDEEFFSLLLNGGKSMDVGLDGNNLMPYHIDEIFDLMKDRPVKKEGHH